MKYHRLVLLFVAGVVALAGCSQRQTASSEESSVVEQRVALDPSTVPVSIGPLSGELSDLSVMRRVDESTGEVFYAPQLMGTLTLRNTSEDQAVRLIGGEVVYVGAEGAPIDISASRHDTEFTFPSYSVERLDPGDEMRHSLDVPYPAAAFDGGLAELRLGLEYISMPYREETVTVGMAVEARG